MTSKNESYWAKVLFREFVSHFIEMTDEDIVKDVRRSIVALTKLSDDGDSFGAKMVNWANERRTVYKASAANGSMGGRPKKNDGAMVKLPEHLVYGCNENVFLTMDQHTELAKRLGNVNELARLVDNFSNALADGSKKSQNHFATLCNWISFRNEQASKGDANNTLKFEDWNEKSARIYNEAIARLEAKYGGG